MVFQQLLHQRSTADAGIKDLSVENPELSKVLSLQRGAGRNIALHASPTAMNAVRLISAFPAHSFTPVPFQLELKSVTKSE